VNNKKFWLLSLALVLALVLALAACSGGTDGSTPTVEAVKIEIHATAVETPVETVVETVVVTVVATPTPELAEEEEGNCQDSCSSDDFPVDYMTVADFPDVDFPDICGPGSVAVKVSHPAGIGLYTDQLENNYPLSDAPNSTWVSGYDFGSVICADGVSENGNIHFLHEEEGMDGWGAKSRAILSELPMADSIDAWKEILAQADQYKTVVLGPALAAELSGEPEIDRSCEASARWTSFTGRQVGNHYEFTVYLETADCEVEIETAYLAHNAVYLFQSTTYDSDNNEQIIVFENAGCSDVSGFLLLNNRAILPDSNSPKFTSDQKINFECRN
jgi:hypothetical protein